MAQCSITKSLIFSRGILKIPHLNAFLHDSELISYSRLTKTIRADNVIGWGLRPSADKARAYAEQHYLPYIALEDGFLRSLGLGVMGYPPFSVVYDDVGIYYDTTRSSRLEQLILSSHFSATDLQQAEQAVQLIVRHQLSKYNHNLDYVSNEPKTSEIVLVIDQTFGDMAVKYGWASELHFKQMLDTAIRENPSAEIWVKTHPDVISGKKKGYLTDLHSYGSQIRLFAEDVNPISLLSQVDKVYCVTSQMGFEALLLGKPVITFGIPWFAGWGITDDRHPDIDILKLEQRRKNRSFIQLFAAAYLQYSRYINPYTGKVGTIFDVIDYLSKAKILNQRLSGHLYCVGMSLWKRAVIKPFFNLPLCRLHFVGSLKSLEKRVFEKNARLLIWSQGKPEILAFAEKHNLPLLRMEDGFIRSVGLGSNLVAPLSLVIDDLGIYFNAQTPSRLEQILLGQEFNEQDLVLAKKLRNRLIEANIGKYNVGNSGFRLNVTDKTAILVPGQVEDDASIRFGSPEIKKNLDLLRKVRELNPNAYIIYKPHPDVVSGNRQGHIPTEQAVEFADEIVENANILDCINQVDEVHTMTSLAGFEALLRGKIVHCYGLPFYSNWGLTEDYLSLERRHRKLCLEELISAVLVYYPQYVDPENATMINAEQAIEILQQQKQQLSHSGIKRPWIAKQFGKLKQLYRTLQ
ncbi:capsular polysaccharide biosynthesis protein [Actinobacillus pleuropneumoniae]|uniref:Capsule polysaccharide modification protein lipA n=1 Tax=Actinobacillus pleuropneumoniae serovar 6 str. Femo TaxID=754256 RepID=A0A828PPC8_ACTPL|nr:capsular polysaccharide biosynthesis protein [Actinobacillus pleuropneumoniae]EFL81154.1 capsule polysaccharide modification protein LipA [Actinobacillus pleuropneumoniae serovar 6 str. Femo]EFM91084.1 Capsule polysaccharide modification protein lipA [Actinobacillus pleuropneumoniae serovar 6 str. Femo]UKH12138.1 capsular polysaccharide biosynthesis protein [Actinobacillus pleuropneumoniae serovar 6 str. Femo]SUU53903.1 capsule polysaccharide modification protein [Actinobacillus pleuropneumo